MGSVPGRATDTNKGSPGLALLTRGTTGSWIAGVTGLRDVGERLSPTRGARNLSCTLIRQVPAICTSERLGAVGF